MAIYYEYYTLRCGKYPYEKIYDCKFTYYEQAYEKMIELYQMETAEKCNHVFWKIWKTSETKQDGEVLNSMTLQV